MSSSEQGETPSPIRKPEGKIEAKKSEKFEYDPTTLEFQSKIIQGHTKNTGDYFGKFCSGFAAYARHLAEIRDKGDDIARNFAQYSETQAHSTTKKQLTEFSGYLASVQDHMHARILRIENKVVCGFAKYGTMCHIMKEEVERGVNIRDKEHKYQEDLQKMSVKISIKSTDNESQARQQNADYAAMATSDAQRAHGMLLREADKFEQHKLEDIRQVLMNFCEIELAFHSRALKLYTQAYRSAKKLDMTNDIVNFRTQMNIVRGSSSIEPDPNLVLEKCKVGCVPPKTSSDTDLSSMSMSDGGGGGVNERKKLSKGANRDKILRQTSCSSRITETLRKKGKKKGFNWEMYGAPMRYTNMITGTCAKHFEDYEYATRPSCQKN